MKILNIAICIAIIYLSMARQSFADKTILTLSLDQNFETSEANYAGEVFETKPQLLFYAAKENQQSSSNSVDEKKDPVEYVNEVSLFVDSKKVVSSTTPPFILRWTPSRAGIFKAYEIASLKDGSMLRSGEGEYEEKEATLEILPAIDIPPIKVNSTSVMGTFGHKVTLKVLQPIGEEYLYQWGKMTKNGKWKAIDGATTAKLDITELRYSDTGYYSCLVRKGTASRESPEISVDVVKHSRW